jgi:hypothetical protein
LDIRHSSSTDIPLGDGAKSTGGGIALDRGGVDVLVVVGGGGDAGGVSGEGPDGSWSFPLVGSGIGVTFARLVPQLLQKRSPSLF